MKNRITNDQNDLYNTECVSVCESTKKTKYYCAYCGRPIILYKFPEKYAPGYMHCGCADAQKEHIIKTEMAKVQKIMEKDLPKPKYKNEWIFDKDGNGEHIIIKIEEENDNKKE